MHSAKGISKFRLLVVPNIRFIVSFPFPFLHALTLALANFSIAKIGSGSEGGKNDSPNTAATEAKAAATGSLPSMRLRLCYVKPGNSSHFSTPLLLFGLFEGEDYEG